MRLAEQRVWDTFRRNLAKHTTVKLWRIENTAGNGTPDIFGKARNSDAFWVELKAPTTPVREVTRLFRGSTALSPEQVNWHIDYRKQGGRSFIIARDSEKNLYCFPNTMAEEINRLSLSECRLATIAISWDGIFDYLKGAPYHAQ